MRVLFWGTPEFAAPPLRALIGEGFDVAAVVTQPDKPVGRSRSTLEAPPIKRIAEAEGIEVWQPARPRGDEALLERIRSLAPDLSVVVAYGHLLPPSVIDAPARGTLNIHASLLPALRGAAPIQAAIRGGLAETGVTIMRMIPALDAGPIVHQLRTPIVDDETGGELALRLSELGALALIEALAMLELGAAREEAQTDALATYAPKIDRAATRVDWAQPADDVARVIRAYDPKPGAFAEHRGAGVKLFGARVATADAPNTGAPGTVAGIDDSGMVVRCGSGAVRIALAQPAGKRRIAPADWANGRGIALGERLT